MRPVCPHCGSVHVVPEDKSCTCERCGHTGPRTVFREDLRDFSKWVEGLDLVGFGCYRRRALIDEAA